MMQIHEYKDPSNVFPKPPLPPSTDADYMTSLMSGAMLLSLVMRKPLFFFIVATVFFSRCLTAEGRLNWIKAVLPLSGMIPAFAKMLYEIVECLWTGTPL
ncbi:hypothetical protein X943_002872 [Babesia divergens]|uniref:Uncharacterized protein n=1 Tax=Babesia divergens TaxID=32595 RepID=A0AAD9GFL6_BABDI|nr:hypothetical protein X943_002872 [Babesia divergens]